jgi:UPF0042 nucleotide-binding protein
MRFIVLTGTSGAGKMTAFLYFGDLGYYAADNLPPRLLPELAESCRAAGRERVLAVVDARAGADIAELPDVLSEMASQGAPAELLFLDAGDEVLVRRFKETRRPHPIFEEGRGSILDAVQTERRMLEDIRARADKVIDTSNLNPAELCRSLAEVTGERAGARMLITVESFGFKHGLPIDADLVFDVRFLVNPHYIPEMKLLTGLSPEVARFIHGDSLTGQFLIKLYEFITFTLPHYEREGKAYLTIAIGCTGGQHRSVRIAEDLADLLRGEGYRALVFHRDIAVRPVREPTK